MSTLELPTFIASVVIPAHNRNDKLNRAVLSVLMQNGAERVQIIVVDDCSTPPLHCPYLRVQDRFIRNTTNQGAPASRNTGIRLAEGALVYLLDSDDQFIQRDFIADYQAYAERTGLYFVNIISADQGSHYPEWMERGDFVDYTMGGRHPLIGQTSSLMFPARSKLYFDESLPKHQDWDLVFTYLCQGERMWRMPGLVAYDVTDKASVSRTYSPHKSLPWLNKLSKDASLGCSREEVEYITYLLMNYSQAHYSWRNWIKWSSGLLLRRRISLYAAMKSLYLRITKESFSKSSRA